MPKEWQFRKMEISYSPGAEVTYDKQYMEHRWKYSWRNESQIEKYKVRLISKGFSQEKGIDFEEIVKVPVGKNVISTSSLQTSCIVSLGLVCHRFPPWLFCFGGVLPLDFSETHFDHI